MPGRYVALAALVVLTAAGCAVMPAAAPPAPAPSIAVAAFADADSVQTLELAPGVLHARVHDARGPWTSHIIEVDVTVCVPRLEARKPQGRLSGRAPTSQLADGALVAVNADFFRTPGGTPVGAHVERGVPFIGPTAWPVFAVTAENGWYAGTAELRGRARVGSDSARTTQVNRSSVTFTAWRGTQDGLVLFTARADSVPADSAAVRVLLRPLHGDERSGSGIVQRTDPRAPLTFTTTDSLAIFAYGSARAWAARRTTGDTVVWQTQVTTAAGDIVLEALGGFPELLRDGTDVLATQTVRAEFGQQRHPRTAIGWTADRRRLFLVVVDGRQPGYSEGMSLPELIWAFRRLGVAHALNFDGGGSTALAIAGALVNRPSDADGERAVGNVLALSGCR